MLAVPLVTSDGLYIGGEERVVMPGDQLVAKRSKGIGKTVIRSLHADPHGVATCFRDLAHVEDGSERRRGKECHIGVPPRGSVHPSVDREHLRVAGE